MQPGRVISNNFGGELYMLSLMCNDDKNWDYFRFYLAYGYSGTYWAGLEIEIDFSAAIE